MLRAINATEEAVWESLHGESQGCALPAGQLPGLADGKEVAEAYRELEENVRLPRASGQRGVGTQRNPPQNFLLVGRSALKGRPAEGLKSLVLEDGTTAKADALSLGFPLLGSWLPWVMSVVSTLL